jgi:hypothetical protein
METYHFKKLSRADRFDIQILGNITLEKDGEKEESYICNTVNISLSGALVETSSIIPLGSLLKYTFRMPGFSVPVNVIGEVVRGVRDTTSVPSSKSPKGGKRKKAAKAKNPGADCAGEGVKKLNRYGIIFLDMNKQDKLALEIYLVQNRNKIPENEFGPDND